jgi:hypothetical protein
MRDTFCRHSDLQLETTHNVFKENLIFTYKPQNVTVRISDIELPAIRHLPQRLYDVHGYKLHRLIQFFYLFNRNNNIQVLVFLPAFPFFLYRLA